MKEARTDQWHFTDQLRVNNEFPLVKEARKKIE